MPRLSAVEREVQGQGWGGVQVGRKEEGPKFTASFKEANNYGALPRNPCGCGSHLPEVLVSFCPACCPSPTLPSPLVEITCLKVSEMSPPFPFAVPRNAFSLLWAPWCFGFCLSLLCVCFSSFLQLNYVSLKDGDSFLSPTAPEYTRCSAEVC